MVVGVPYNKRNDPADGGVIITVAFKFYRTGSISDGYFNCSIPPYGIVSLFTNFMFTVVKPFATVGELLIVKLLVIELGTVIAIVPFLLD